MKHIRHNKHRHLTNLEKNLLGITLGIAITIIVIVLFPVVVSLGAERVPKDIPLLQVFPIQP